MAHARFIAEGRKVRIQGFRQRTYHAGYVEPRLSSRDEILLASYQSAKAQLLKAGYSNASRPFILEDTSVRIDALSEADIDVPGVDVKYWMEGRSFEHLDRMLRATGGERGATVRSDVLLHVPSGFREAWGIDKEFVIFTGEQRGTIVSREQQFSSNLVYPWLDNKSFNKWFVPDGHSEPFGSLQVTQANEVDFRRKSFEKLFDFLQEREYFAVPSRQMKLQLERKPNIILCGYTCAGKTEGGQYLARNFGYLHIEASDFMYLSYYNRHGYSENAPIGNFAEAALLDKPTIAADQIVEYIIENISEPIVISGFRSPEEIDHIEARMATYGKRFTSRFVTADDRMRFERLVSRGRPSDHITLAEFLERDEQQERMGLELIQNSPGIKSLENRGSLNSYLAKIDEIVEEAPGQEMNLQEALGRVSAITDIGLQDAILVALLSVWENNEARKFYTTTEISHIISRVFSSMKRKHKDNVSRYFNQDYYAYYEINNVDVTSARRYRLSNTGYGMAIKVLRLALVARKARYVVTD